MLDCIERLRATFSSLLGGSCDTTSVGQMVALRRAEPWWGRGGGVGPECAGNGEPGTGSTAG
jgi:hypothetical protein